MSTTSLKFESWQEIFYPDILTPGKSGSERKDISLKSFFVTVSLTIHEPMLNKTLILISAGGVCRSKPPKLFLILMPEKFDSYGFRGFGFKNV